MPFSSAENFVRATSRTWCSNATNRTVRYHLSKLTSRVFFFFIFFVNLSNFPFDRICVIYLPPPPLTLSKCKSRVIVQSAVRGKIYVKKVSILSPPREKWRPVVCDVLFLIDTTKIWCDLEFSLSARGKLQRRTRESERRKKKCAECSVER